MTDATIIIAEARSWIGTPFKHQGRSGSVYENRGGVDCLGLLMGVAGALQLTDKKGRLLTAYDRRDYSRLPDGVQLTCYLNEALFSLAEENTPSAADIGLFMIDGVPRHLAIFADYPAGGLSLIHAYAPARKVVEHYYDAIWQKRYAAGFRLTGDYSATSK